MTTETVYHQSKILDFRHTKDRPLFILNKILNQKEIFSVLTNLLSGTLIPSSFIALGKLQMTFEEFVEEICTREEIRIIGEFVNEERDLLRDERKRRWGYRTRRPFRGIIDTIKPTFTEILNLAGEVVEKLGLPDIHREKKQTMGEK